jgi:hypothetical protein
MSGFLVTSSVPLYIPLCHACHVGITYFVDVYMMWSPPGLGLTFCSRIDHNQIPLLAEDVMEIPLWPRRQLSRAKKTCSVV